MKPEFRFENHNSEIAKKYAQRAKVPGEISQDELISRVESGAGKNAPITIEDSFETVQEIQENQKIQLILGKERLIRAAGYYEELSRMCQEHDDLVQQIEDLNKELEKMIQTDGAEIQSTFEYQTKQAELVQKLRLFEGLEEELIEKHHLRLDETASGLKAHAHFIKEKIDTIDQLISPDHPERN